MTTHWRRRGALGIVLAAVACRSVEVPQASPAADAAVETSSATAANSPAPQVREMFHLPDAPDERNLVLEPDGTFFWEVYGCDYSGGGCGTWSIVGTTLVLTSKPPTKLSWPTFGVGPVASVVLSRKGGSLEARVTDLGGKVTVQTWLRARSA